MYKLTMLNEYFTYTVTTTRRAPARSEARSGPTLVRAGSALRGGDRRYEPASSPVGVAERG